MTMFLAFARKLQMSVDVSKFHNYTFWSLGHLGYSGLMYISSSSIDCSFMLLGQQIGRCVLTLYDMHTALKWT